MADADIRFDAAKQHFLDGLAHVAAGRFAAAEQAFLASLERVPQRASTLVNLAATRLQLGQPEGALDAANQVIALEPANAEALFHRATALDRLGRAGDALAAYDRVLAVAPALGAAWSQRGGVLREMGRLDEAAHAYARAIACGADAALNRYYLAAVGAHDSPATAPRGYVQALFDGYAEQFDAHLVGTLGYRAPATLVRAPARARPRPVPLRARPGLRHGAVRPARPAAGGPPRRRRSLAADARQGARRRRL